MVLIMQVLVCRRCISIAYLYWVRTRDEQYLVPKFWNDDMTAPTGENFLEPYLSEVNLENYTVGL